MPEGSDFPTEADAIAVVLLKPGVQGRHRLGVAGVQHQRELLGIQQAPVLFPVPDGAAIGVGPYLDEALATGRPRCQSPMADFGPM